jgi:uncharacterized membrane protein YfhO
MSATATGYRGEAWLEPPTGAARVAYSSSNVIGVEVDAKESSTLVLNRNADTGWSVANMVLASPFADEQQRLALRVPAGVYTVMLRYQPPGLIWGLILLVVGLGGSTLLWLRQRP